ncbi:MAG: thioredoxin family protein [Eubacteriales bacterium]|nr:thioredoxin family protein [Eubacteriales bacterium]
MIREVNAKELKEITKEGLHLVDIYGSNCSPCKYLAEVLESFDIDYPFVSILKLNADENPELRRELQIFGVPTILLYKNGEIIERQVSSMSFEELEEFLAPHLYD